MLVSAIFFDVGETLVDETEVWGAWADWLGVTRLTFFAALGAVVASGGDHREVFRLVRPELDFAEASRQRGVEEQGFTVDDLYPDAISSLQMLSERGYRIGIAANQPARMDAVLRASGLTFDWLLISELEGVQKPAPAFFERIVEVTGLPPQAIAYVGDRVDYDVIPAHNAGLVAVHIRRGPWGVIHSERSEVELAALRVTGLQELVARVGELGRSMS
jgi:FMN phosphatase YigB (HAD superfamily)